MKIVFSQWMNWQKELASLSDKSKQCIVKGSGHLIHIDKPQIVINAIKRIILYDLKNRLPEKEKTVEIPESAMKQFCGKYLYDVNDILTIKEENGHILADIPDLMQTEMVPVSTKEIISMDMDIAATKIILTEKGIILKNQFSDDERNIIKIPDDYLTPNECLISGKTDEAIQKYKEIKKSDSDNAAVSESKLNNLGYNLMKMGKIEEALKIFKLNVDFYPQSANVYDSYAEVLLKTGKKEEAIKNYQKSLELNPNNTNAIKQLQKIKENN
jgi:tetratricopeptide (TPR) repeat protein